MGINRAPSDIVKQHFMIQIGKLRLQRIQRPYPRSLSFGRASPGALAGPRSASGVPELPQSVGQGHCWPGCPDRHGQKGTIGSSGD